MWGAPWNLGISEDPGHLGLVTHLAAHLARAGDTAIGMVCDMRPAVWEDKPLPEVGGGGGSQPWGPSPIIRVGITSLVTIAALAAGSTTYACTPVTSFGPSRWLGCGSLAHL